MDSSLAFAADHATDFEQRLFDLLRIESVSTQPNHTADCARAADWLAADLTRAGLENVEVMPTGGHPAVYADWLHAGDDAQTVLIYGHYDVQPVEPIELWKTPPFEPTCPGDGNVYARGAADDKGQVYIHVAAIESMLATDGTLPVNMKFLIEGEEESGSEHLEQLVHDRREQLACDMCMVSDTHMLSAEQPSIVSSLRGMAYCEVTVHGPAVDLHSGTFGGGIRNPAEALARIIAQLKDDDGRILIDGFYDDVVDPSDDDRAELARVPFSDTDFLHDAGVSAGFGETGWTMYEQVGARPTLEVNGIWGGYTGEGAKTVLPAEASAKISMRLVANQDWRDINEKFTATIKRIAAGMAGVESVDVRALHGGDPTLVDLENPAMQAATRALEATFGVRPVFTREGGSIPVVATFEAVLDASTVLMGFGLPDDRLHSPNEKFSLDQFHKGIATSIRFWHEL